MVWKNQVLALIKGNLCPDQFLTQPDVASWSAQGGSGSIVENAVFSAWIRIDQLLLSWMFSSIQENLLTFVIHCVSFQQLWESLTRMFISQTQA